MSTFHRAATWTGRQHQFRQQFGVSATSVSQRPVHAIWFTTDERANLGRPWDRLLVNAPRWEDLNNPQLMALAGSMMLAGLWLTYAPIALLGRIGLLVLLLAVVVLGLSGGLDATVAPAGRFLAVYRPDGARRAPASLVMPIDDHALRGERSGQASAQFFGRLEASAACCVVVDGIVVWPAGPPFRRHLAAPGR